MSINGSFNKSIQIIFVLYIIDKKKLLNELYKSI